MKRVLIGLIGTKTDSGTDVARWDFWRPTVSLFQHQDLLWDRLELLAESNFARISQQVLDDVRQVSPETETRLHTVSYGNDPWDLETVYATLHDWARGYTFDRDNEEYFIHITTGTHIAQISLFLLNEAGTLPGKLIQSSPPPSALSRQKKPEPRYSVIDLDLSKYDQLSTRFQKEHVEVTDFLKSGIATRNAGFNRLIERIEQVALRSQAPVLLTGPTGAGKSHLARRIYELRKQRGGLRGNFVEVNCATLTGDTAASALFGHTRGSFTGAQKDRPGLLREADGGLLFLDEIGELGTDEQAMLLRALEDKTFLPVGSDKPVKSDFQLIAGTNRDLREAVVTGRFREDLLARIHLWTFALPALAQRREDIAPNLEYELDRHRRSTGREVSFNKEAKLAFLKFAEAPDSRWSGNFRDLNAAVTRMATLAPRGRIRVEEVEEEIQRLRENWHRPGAQGREAAVDLKAVMNAEQLDGIDPFDRVQLTYVVEVCRRVKTLSEAGREIFAISRNKRSVTNDADRLKKYLAKFELKFESLRC
ncbi:sigma 54-interacting transcriptional regulator [Luteolibacter yonseiensis]|uniref:Sigma 54-interacting transcriptional regulator n=1 Tax=Luteolibacter yonseiensis TaxID=1144680 RepID=A0A934VAU1_9BACT|nr:RNA repair transcriptional activator RtcR [Luteolibacter yonseiensis]MBK1815480.1 sigma 54-interacting transcriptional regulator [Luteolibacter yonseiensis]